MSVINVLRGLGLFVEEDFLDGDLCARIRSEVRSADQEPAGTYCGKERRIEPDFRRTARARVSAATIEQVHDKCSALSQKLEAHFGFPPESLDDLQFLRYTEGDFFRPHVDDSQVERRRLSLVVFLNDQSEEPRELYYGGGALTFYGLLDDPRAAKIGIPLVGRTGLAVAFRSEVLHEVEPITHGERYTIVNWYR